MNPSSSNRMIVSDPLAGFQKESMLKVVVPAKTNLVLAIGGLRADGYHEATTIMHALSLHDVLHVDHYTEGIEGLEIEVQCIAREGLDPIEILSEENLASRAIRLLSEKLDRTSNERFVIRIEKHIPLQAGLGGGSADAAGALVAASHVWGIDIHSEAVLSAAAELGSDVSFFLYGGCAYLTGTGEDFQHTLEPMKKAVALIKPEGGVSTKLAYQTFDKNPLPVPEEILVKASTARLACDVPFFNNLSAAAERILPELTKIRKWAKDQEGIDEVLLSGSGSATVVVCNSFDNAYQLVSAAKTEGWWARTTSFSSLRASIIQKR